MKKTASKCKTVSTAAKPKQRRIAAQQPPRKRVGSKSSHKRTQHADFPKSVKSRGETKQAIVIALLRTAAGATIEAMVGATGWQPHSVRGFLAGVVRKKLGLSLVSEADEAGRIYRITDGKAPSGAAAITGRAA